MPVAQKTSDPAERIAKYPPQHFIDCPAATDAELAAQYVEHYRERRITVKERPQDVTADKRPSVAIMVSHCCLCGGMNYHDL